MVLLLTEIGVAMPATATLNARVAAADKKRFTNTANALGISPSAAINIFVRKFNEMGGFPFDVRLTAEPFASEHEACDFADAMAKDMIDNAW